MTSNLDILHDREIEHCRRDPVYFINEYVRLFADDCSPQAIMLDDLKTEFLHTMETNKFVIGRYPRIYGKTTLLMAYALHQSLFKGEEVGIFGADKAHRVHLMREIVMTHRELPKWMQANLIERPDYLRFDGLKGNIQVKGNIHTFGFSRYSLSGCKLGLILIDDPKEVWDVEEFDVEEFRQEAKASSTRVGIIGTFSTDRSAVGRMWFLSRKTKTDVVSLPSLNEEWKINVMLSMGDYLLPTWV